MSVPLIRAIKPKEAIQILRAHGLTMAEVKLDMGLRQGVFPSVMPSKCRAVNGATRYTRRFSKGGSPKGVPNNAVSV